MPARRSSPSPGRTRRLRLLFASAELAPWVQGGGLGDAVGGLARALAARGHEVACALPAWRPVLAHPELPALEPEAPVELAVPGGELRGRWLGGVEGGIGLRLLELPALYDREGPYGEGVDEALRFAAFSRAVAALAARERPDVLVAHDWHAALSICCLRTLHDVGAARSVGTVQAVHNNAYQGRFPAEAMAWTGLPGPLFQPEGLEFFGDLSLLKGGLLWADRIAAVSPSYARELQTPEGGDGLDGVYRSREHRLVGIANGIEVERWDPGADPALPAAYSARRPAGKRACRAALLEELGLEPPPPGRLAAAIGRLVDQKGWDVLEAALPKLVADGASLALVGDGDGAIAARLAAAARTWPGRVAFARGWNEALARRLYAAADCVLIPSRFEPCGLVQLIAQRYGALPVAHRVGGLGDTIEDGETGVLFAPLGPEPLAEAAGRAAGLLAGPSGPGLVRRLLRLDVSWSRPAARWEALLAAVAREAAGRL